MIKFIRTRDPFSVNGRTKFSKLRCLLHFHENEVARPEHEEKRFLLNNNFFVQVIDLQVYIDRFTFITLMRLAGDKSQSPIQSEDLKSLFIHEIVSFYMVFLGIVFKTRLKYSKELLTIMLKIQKLTLSIIRVTMGHGVLEKSFP